MTPRVEPSQASKDLIARLIESDAEITMEDAMAVRDAFFADGGTECGTVEEVHAMLVKQIPAARALRAAILGL